MPFVIKHYIYIIQVIVRNRSVGSPQYNLMSRLNSRLELHSLVFFDKISTKQGIHKYGTYGMLKHISCELPDR